MFVHFLIRLCIADIRGIYTSFAPSPIIAIVRFSQYHWTQSNQLINIWARGSLNVYGQNASAQHSNPIK